MIFGKLDIKGKELPEDFLDYFTAEGVEVEDCPYDFFDERLSNWVDRQREIAFMFMTDKQKKGFRAMERNWTGKANSSLGIETA